jgi:hypothetical protein
MWPVKLLFCLFALLLSKSGFAQVAEITPLPQLYRNSVYLELAGNAGVLSLNYERLIPVANSRKTLALRAGGIMAPYGNRRDRFGFEFAIPVEASMLMGKRAVK